MENKYESMPQIIDAFQFLLGDTKVPEWFIKSVEIGGASVTIGHKAKYITINGRNQVEKAYEFDWVCRSEHGKIFVLDDANFKRYWRRIESKQRINIEGMC